MNRSLFLLLLLVTCFTSKAQIASYDAITLSRQLDNTGHFIETGADADTVKTILTKYLAPGDTITVLGDPRKSPNPILVGFFNPNTTLGGNTARTLSFTGVASSVSGFNVTSIVNGIAELMIERAKEELTIAFFNRFQAVLKKYPEIQTMFPETTTQLGKLLSYNYSQWLPTLRNSFFDDLKQLPNHLQGVLTEPDFQKYFGNIPEVGLAIRTLQIGQDLADGTTSAADALDSIAGISYWTDTHGSTTFKNIGSLVKFSALISNSLRNDSTKNPSSPKDIWISSQNGKKLLTDATVGKLYLGLLYQLLRKSPILYYVTSDSMVDIKTYVNNQVSNILFFQTKISAFLNTAGQLSAALSTVKNAKTPTNTDISNYIGLSVDAINDVFDIVNFFDPKFNGGDYLSLVSETNNVYKDIYSQQYTQAVGDGIDLLTSVYGLIKQNPTPIDKKDSVLGKFLTFLQKVKPYAVFVANMAEAKSADDVKAALENAVLPVGSSAVKKNTNCNIAIQAYLGGYLSTSNGNTSTTGSWSDKLGVTGPIGISWTPGFASWQKGGSLSLFAELFDIGAAIDYQLQRDTTAGTNVVSKSYSIKLGQIVSPGVFVVYGLFDNLPLSVGFGGQYGPGLSKIDAGGNATVVNPSWRWNAFLAVDLPLFNIVNKNRTVKWP